MRIVGKIDKIKGKKAVFIPLDVFPEDTEYFKKIKNKKIEIENRNFEEGEMFVLDKDLSHKILYKNIRKRKNLIFVPERGKYHALLENKNMKVLIDYEKGGRVVLLLDKKRNFEWFFDDFAYINGKPARCGISQGIIEKNTYEKKLEYRVSKKGFYGKREEKDFVFEKKIEINKNRLSFLFTLKSKKEKEFYPFFEINVFTGGEIYKYFLKIRKDKKIIEFPHIGYPFWGWGYNQEFGKVEEIRYEMEKSRITIKPCRKYFLTYSLYYGLNYFINRFYYKKIKAKKGKKVELKLEVRI